MDDPTARVSRLKAESQIAVGVRSKATPSCDSHSIAAGAPLRIAAATPSSQRPSPAARVSARCSDSRHPARCWRQCRLAQGCSTFRDPTGRSRKHYRSRRQRKRRCQAGEPPPMTTAAPSVSSTVVIHRQHPLDSEPRARSDLWLDVTSCRIVSSAWRILPSVILFMCGHRLQGRMNSRSG